MAKMQKPELKVVRFSAEDVIATSGGPSGPSVRLSNLGNGEASDNTWTIGGTDYTAYNFLDVQAALGGNGWSQPGSLTKWWYKDTNTWTGLQLQDLLDYDKSGYGDYNGTYTWTDSGAGYWYKISD